VASKHDAKRARENMWVTFDNLKRSNGGRPKYEGKGHVHANCAGALPRSLAERLTALANASETAAASE